MDNIIRTIIIALLEILKWIILANVLLSWLPLLGVRLPPYHPVVSFIHRVSNPILAPFRPYARLGAMDLSPIIVFFLIGLIQNVVRQGLIALTGIIATAIVLVIAFTVHEFAHAYTAFQLGDSTAKNQGRITLDPRKHLDVLGSLMLLTVGFGWAKPVPVNPNYLRSGPKIGMLIVAAVGPLSNLILAVLGAVATRSLLAGGFISLTDRVMLGFLPTLSLLLSVFVFINVLLFFFNLLPIAPLDGFKVVVGLLPYPTSLSFQKLEPAGPLILFLLLIFGRGLISFLVGTPTTFVTSLLMPTAF